MKTIDELSKQADDLQLKYHVAKRVRATAESTLVTCEDTYYKSTQALEIVRTVAAGIQKTQHDRIAGIVTQCLATVFTNPYTFKIILPPLNGLRGATEAKPVFVRKGKELDPLDDTGGGVVDVAAFALRAASLMLSRPPARRVMVLDEPFKFVSEDRRHRVVKMLEDLSQPPPVGLGIQFIMVTHIKELMCGKIIKISDEMAYIPP